MCLRADGGSDGSLVKTASCDENDTQQVMMMMVMVVVVVVVVMMMMMMKYIYNALKLALNKCILGCTSPCKKNWYNTGVQQGK